MTSKERVQLVLQWCKPDRLPFNFWMDRRLMANFEEKYGPYWRPRHFGADVWESFVLYPWPSGERRYENGTSWLIKPLLDSVEELPGLELPDPDTDSYYDLLRKDRKELPEVFMTGALISPLGILDGIRGFQNFFLDVYDAPEILDDFGAKVAQINARLAENMIECGIDCLYLMEDLGSRDGLLMSKAHLDRFIIQPLIPALEVAKSHGLPVFFHTDGAVMDILDRFVELGIDMVNPLQPHLNDHQLFHQKYHGKLGLYGGGDNTYIIPESTPEEVRRHVLDLFHLHGAEGGFIFSTHDIPLETPLENVEAMLEALKECTYEG